MAETTRNTPRSNYLTRLAELAVGHTLESEAHTGAGSVVLRPRLPSRFEAIPETADEEPVWGELESERVHGDEAAAEELDGPRPRRASTPPASSSLRAAGEPQPVPRRTREGDPARRGTQGTTPGGEQVVRPVEAPERRVPVRLNLPPIESASQPSPTAIAAETQVSAAGEAPANPSPARSDRRSRRIDAVEPSATPRPQPAQAEAEEQVEERARPARTTLRPMPSPPRRDETDWATPPPRAAGVRSEPAPVGAAERRIEPVPPVINVTIGRIEVRAPAAPPTPPVTHPELPRPAVSLEEYLQRRADGRF